MAGAVTAMWWWVLGCAAPAPAPAAPWVTTEPPPTVRGRREPVLMSLGSGRIVHLVPTVEGPELRLEDASGLKHWRLGPEAATQVEAAAPVTVDVAVQSDCAAGLIGPVVVRGGGVVLDPCAGVLIRWGGGWSVRLDVGRPQGESWLVGQGDRIDLVERVDEGVLWRAWDTEGLTPVGAMAWPVPGPGERRLPVGVEHKELAPLHELVVRLGFVPRAAARSGGSLWVAGELEGPTVLLARAHGSPLTPPPR